MTRKFAPRILFGIPTTSNARSSRNWWQSKHGIQWPLGSSMAEYWVEDKPIADARNELCEVAIQGGYDYLFTISDDVLVPPDTVLRLLDKIGRFFPDERGNLVRASMITGVYWTKTNPSEAYIYRDITKGWYKDWKEGDFFPIDFAGCDCLMVEVAMLKELRAKEPDRPFFSTSWKWHDDAPLNSMLTEDFWFQSHARKHGYRLWCDSDIQCAHEDRSTGVLYMLRDDMPQAGGVPECGDDTVMVADIGAGYDSPYFGENAKVVRFDIQEKTKPDVRCDFLHIPEQWADKFDVVHARHVLEHVNRRDMETALRGWANLLKDGGKLIIRVPNVGNAFKVIQEYPDGHPAKQYAWQQIYGGQSIDRYDHHATGFTAKKLEMSLRLLGCFSDVTVETENDDLNLKAVGVFQRPRPLMSFEAMWEQIRAQEAQQEGSDGDQPEQPARGPEHRDEETAPAAGPALGGDGPTGGEEVSGTPGL